MVYDYEFECGYKFFDGGEDGWWINIRFVLILL